ncbi:hypothetical protein C0Q70_15628 [Pomacea canaliculata]|uniref:Interferon-induced transmembrane protein n=1 Tax=Pomacea canaliculata TaxID=400727 RepID=A0A2T7NVD2_POMCA|nr:uncharacterized protein LOC112571703 [Pomacea canaliculata]PVD25130.1 hypothetical protein C0Q70_15628 [Pomacea canaliculata]
MSEVATIDHTSVYVDVEKRKNGPVTSQPAKGQGQQGQAEFDAETAKVIFTQGGLPIVAQQPDPKEKPKDWVNTSCAVIFLCNFVFGLLGWHYGSKSNNAWQVGDIEEARRHGRKALIFAICGVIAGLCTYALAFGLFFGVYAPANSR